MLIHRFGTVGFLSELPVGFDGVFRLLFLRLNIGVLIRVVKLNNLLFLGLTP